MAATPEGSRDSSQGAWLASELSRGDPQLIFSELAMLSPQAILTQVTADHSSLHRDRRQLDHAWRA